MGDRPVYVDPQAKALEEWARVSGQVPPSTHYRFEPKEDVTAFEVAKLLQAVGMGCDKTFFEQMPPELQRHMVKVVK